MQSSRIPIIIFLLTTLYYPILSFTDGPSRHIIVNAGRSLQQDQVCLNVTQKFSHWDSAPKKPINIVETYSVNLEGICTITRIEVTRTRSDAQYHAGIITGGLGHSFVSIQYTLSMYGDYEFEVTLYGEVKYNSSY